MMNILQARKKICQVSYNTINISPFTTALRKASEKSDTLPNVSEKPKFLYKFIEVLLTSCLLFGYVSLFFLAKRTNIVKWEGKLMASRTTLKFLNS